MLGDGCRVWHFVARLRRRAHRRAAARSARTSTSATTCVIGDNVKIQNNVSVYDAVDARGRRVLRPEHGVHQRLQPALGGRRARTNTGRTLVQRGATLGANCTIVCGTTIGEHAFVGAGARGQPRRADFALMVGRPGAPDRLDEPLRRAPGAAAARRAARPMCPHTGDRYVLRRRRAAASAVRSS